MRLAVSKLLELAFPMARLAYGCWIQFSGVWLCAAIRMRLNKVAPHLAVPNGVSLRSRALHLRSLRKGLGISTKKNESNPHSRSERRAGKTTLARNLSVAASLDGRKVLCLDLDPQGSLRGWWESREAETPAMLDRDPAPHALRATLDAAKAQFDLCIIDTPPAAPEWLI